MFKRNFKAPDYYEKFKCKCGDCRTCCCGGWRVTINLNEYFRLVGLKCEPELRERIDKALSILPDATTERYASINPSYNGDCLLRREDGLCALQAEVGEDVLPSVCRYYPRSPRLYPENQVCISNSCEKVLEDLIESDEPMKFVEHEYEFYFDDDEPINAFKDDAVLEMFECIDWLNKFENFKDCKNGLILHLNGSIIDFGPNLRNAYLDSFKELYRKSYSIMDYMKEIVNFDDIETKYDELKKILPRIDIYFKKILSNHLFYMKFPYTEFKLTKEEAAIVLESIYMFWVNILYYQKEGMNETKFIDITGRFFRVIEHTGYYKNVLAIYSKYCTTE